MYANVQISVLWTPPITTITTTCGPVWGILEGKHKSHEFEWCVLTPVRKTSHPPVLTAPEGAVSTLRVFFLKSIIQPKIQWKTSLLDQSVGRLSEVERQDLGRTTFKDQQRKRKQDHSIPEVWDMVRD